MDTISEDRAKISAARYCAYQERCSSEVYNKLQKMGLTTPQINRVLAALEGENFFNDLRFATHFVHGKLHFKKWGRKRIKMALFQKRIAPEIIEQALNAIDPDEYQDILIVLLNKKVSALEKPYDMSGLHKVVQYLYSKGFETDLVWNIIREKGLDKCSEV